jgi:16S rRNA (cytosine1402-N4)-methyltransferase
MSKQFGSHYSVLLVESIDLITDKPVDSQMILADLTFGGGGHTFALASKYPNSTIYCTDQDLEAYENGLMLIKEKGLEKRIILLNMNFEEFPKYLEENHPDLELDGVVADLGVSSHHFDTPERGFSFRFDADLDMRMNQNAAVSAIDIINEYDLEDLTQIITDYGEERFAARIAEKIVTDREVERITTTKQLENLVFHCYPKAMRHGKIHPATKTFQAFRIAVNRELDVVQNVISKLYKLLNNKGRLVFISFHSLEDRIVKREFKDLAINHMGLLLTKRPMMAQDLELSENARSRSAKLRVIEKDETMEGFDDKGYKKKRKIYK